MLSLHASLLLLAGSFETPQATAGFYPSLSTISEAQKLAKYAASCLGFEDVSTAVKQLTDALRMLTQTGDNPARQEPNTKRIGRS